MKKVLLALFVVACGTTLSAQTTPTKSSMTKDAKTLKGSTDQESQIKAALMGDEDLQDATIKHFEEEPKTASLMSKISEEAGGDKTEMIKSMLGNKRMANMAIDYVKDNPEMLKKAMSFVTK